MSILFADIIIVEQIINPNLSEIFLHEKYTNSYEIFHKLIIQISKVYIIYFLFI